MNLFLSTWSLHRLFFDGALALQSMPALGKSLGFDGVELEDIWFGPSELRSMKRIRTDARRLNCAVLLAMSNDFTVSGTHAQKAQIARTVRFLHAAKLFDSKIVRILMGSRNSRPRFLDRVKSGIAEVLPVAQKLGLKLAIENHDALSRNPEILLSVLDEFRTPDLGVCLDFGNLRPSTRYDALETLSPHALMLHAKSWRFNKHGEEEQINYRRCFSILRKRRFNGPVVVEYDGPGDQLLGSLKTKHLVERYWNKKRTT